MFKSGVIWSILFMFISMHVQALEIQLPNGKTVTQQQYTDFMQQMPALMTHIVDKNKEAVETIAQKAIPAVRFLLFTHPYELGAIPNSPTGLTYPQLTRFFKKLTEREKLELHDCTPMHLAVFVNAADIIKSLRNMKCPLSVRCGIGEYTPMHLAAKRNPAVIPLLVELGGDINARSCAGNTPLIVSCQGEGNMQAARTLIALKADLYLDKFGMNAFHLAAASGLEEQVNALLDAGVFIDQLITYDCTALYLACAHRQDHIVKLLLSRGADARIVCQEKSVLDEMTPRACNLLMPLLRHGAPYPKKELHQKVVSEALHLHLLHTSPIFSSLLVALIKQDNDTFSREAQRIQNMQESDPFGMPLLSWAVVRQNQFALDHLLSIPSSRARINFDHQDDMGRTAIDWANVLSYPEIAQKIEYASCLQHN